MVQSWVVGSVLQEHRGGGRGRRRLPEVVGHRRALGGPIQEEPASAQVAGGGMGDGQGKGRGHRRVHRGASRPQTTEPTCEARALCETTIPAGLRRG